MLNRPREVWNGREGTDWPWLNAVGLLEGWLVAVGILVLVVQPVVWHTCDHEGVLGCLLEALDDVFEFGAIGACAVVD